MKRGHKNSKTNITAEELRRRFKYDPETGKFYTKESVPKHCREGHEIGWISRHAFGKRIKISIRGSQYMAHRLAVLYMTGAWPKFEVDHIDGNGLNNKWKNLRQATSSQNLLNRPIQNNNKTGFKGVCFDNGRQKFMATIKFQGKQKYVGHFDTAEEADKARTKIVKRLHGQFYHPA